MAEFDYCCSAYIKIALLEEENVNSQFLFSTIELREQENLDIGLSPEYFTVDSKRKILFLHGYFDKNDAISWYNDARKGNIFVPPPPHKAKTQYRLNLFEEPKIKGEMTYKRLSYAANIETLSSILSDFSSTPAPFIPNCINLPKIHRLMRGRDDALDDLSQNKKINHFFKKYFSFEIYKYPELLGSLSLIAPSPNVKEAKQQLGSKKDGLEALITIIEAKDYKQLQMMTFESRFGSLSNLKFYPEKEVKRLNINETVQKIEQVGFILWSENDGLIAFHAPLPFLRQINVDANIVSREKQLSLPKNHRKNAENETIIIKQTTGEQITVVSDKEYNEDELASVYYENEQRRKEIAEKDKFQTSWLESREQAKLLIRDIIQKVHKKIHIIDPYLGNLEAFEVLEIITAPQNIDIKILTSKEWLNKQNASEALVKLAEESNKRNRFKSLEIKQMIGTPIIHDRFLIIDNHIWMIGGSLNNLGSRMGVMTKLPYSKEFIKEINKIWVDEAYAEIIFPIEGSAE